MKSSAESYNTRMYSCHPWYGDAGVPFTQIFKPDFLAAMAKVSDEFSSLSDHLLQKDYGSPNKGHPGTPQMQLKSQLAYDLRITKAIAMMRSHVENTELRKVEFFSADTDKFCLELFIRHKSITEWNPQQNPAERSHSSILRMIRIVHAAANDAPLCLWPFTANQAASVHNALITRSATAVNPMSSPQMKTGKLADLSKFRVMYCAVSCVVRSSYAKLSRYCNSVTKDKYDALTTLICYLFQTRKLRLTYGGPITSPFDTQLSSTSQSNRPVCSPWTSSHLRFLMENRCHLPRSFHLVHECRCGLGCCSHESDGQQLRSRSRRRLSRWKASRLRP